MSTSIAVVVVVVVVVAAAVAVGVVSAIMPPRHPIVAAFVTVDAAAQHSRDNYFDVGDY